MFLSECRQFPSAPCLAGKETWWQLASQCCWNRARPWRASEQVSFLVGLNYRRRGNVFELFCLVRKHTHTHRGADKSLSRPGMKQAKVSVRMAWISFCALPCRKRNLITARVSMLLKSRASLTCFRACFLPGRVKDLSAPRYTKHRDGGFRVRTKNRV